MERADKEEVRNHQVDGHCLPGVPGNGRRVILSRSGHVHCCLWARFQLGSLVKDEGSKIEVGVCQGPLRIPVRDYFLDDVRRPGVLPRKTCLRSGRVQPYTPTPAPMPEE